MRITVFRAAGNVGSRVVAEAFSRGHQVIAVVRDPPRFHQLHTAADPRAGDATNVEDVAELSAGQDLVISSTRPAPGRENELLTTTRALLAGVARSGVRLLVVVGAASLIVPGAGGTTVVDAPGFPASLRDLALACVNQVTACCSDTAADWAYLSPAALLEPGERTGTYRLATDELLVDAQGNSTISMEDPPSCYSTRPNGPAIAGPTSPPRTDLRPRRPPHRRDPAPARRGHGDAATTTPPALARPAHWPISTRASTLRLGTRSGELGLEGTAAEGA